MEITGTTASTESVIKPQEPVAPSQPGETTETSGETQQSVESSSFAEFMKKALGGEGKTQVSEEELFAALIEQRLEKESPEAAAAFREGKAFYMEALRRGDGYVCIEEVAKGALQKVVSSGALSEEKAEEICGQAFSAAQLDDNLEFLYDDRGSEEDPTMAVASLEEALAKLSGVVGKLDSGEFAAEPRALDYDSSTGSSSVYPTIESLMLGELEGEEIEEVSEEEEESEESAEKETVGSSGATPLVPSGDAADDYLDLAVEGFSWLPDDNGKVKVIMPDGAKDVITSVGIYRELPAGDANRLDEGTYSGDSADGKPTYTFSKAGGDYGYDVYLVGQSAAGEKFRYSIADGSKEVTV